MHLYAAPRTRTACDQRSATRTTTQPKVFPVNINLKSKQRWSVRLGTLEWGRHTYARSAEDPLQLLGSARKGLQSGALAKLGDTFVLVVGDHVTPLSQADNKDLAAAIAHVKLFEPPYAPPPAPQRSAPPPVVIIKKRRIPAPRS
jgi:hypothetical protein